MNVTMAGRGGGSSVLPAHAPSHICICHFSRLSSSVISLLSEEDRSKRSHGGCTVCCLNGDQRG